MAGVSAEVIAPTVIALGAPAGDRVHASVDSFPAAATTVIPALVKRRIAAFMAAEPDPPILKFSTAWVFGFGFSGLKIQSSAAITPEYCPLPAQFNKRTGTTRAFLANPYFVPAAVAATCVP